MKTATVADLRNNFRRVSTWIEHGDTVCILKRGKPFAQLTALTSKKSAKQLPKVDFNAQLDEVWGDRILSRHEVETLRKLEREADLG